MSTSFVQSLIAPKLRDELFALRRDLHRHPELSFQEHRTAERLQAVLERLVPGQVQRVAGTGVVARIAGHDRGAPLVAIRGDIDALPIHEDTGADFGSETPGVMHACGHDVHAAWTVGAASLLAAKPAAGDVLIPSRDRPTSSRSRSSDGARTPRDRTRRRTPSSPPPP
jgi:hippurate hydrolase